MSCNAWEEQHSQALQAYDWDREKEREKGRECALKNKLNCLALHRLIGPSVIGHFLQPPANHSLLKRVRLRSAANRSEHPYHTSLKHKPYLMKWILAAIDQNLRSNYSNSWSESGWISRCDDNQQINVFLCFKTTCNIKVTDSWLLLL